ncbi:uncharacterized protein [Oryza sativa Japonica Group]|jgi:hypothetical protein|uniref:Expressed protein n=6 Tax=Oryza TaxID=4527 RepID=Q2QND9_ORYSJ|nr:uncharacterized protein LOC9267984 [Oryza sativa Japonica Group]KAB8117903.1 hypothetical protein EE612_060363 [Oryza sativa]ABA99645.1 expressed protein [Oryza sativa Japonica Group]KAF2908407.1 hypothetical protein DAI22_12g182400 [Oryza sativa Japonica Group]BAH95743.1 Os12g0569100 [Oryza sativa Japonica Group]BAT17723.1 Os12g0569200 [Oryza sativa Japonica Group]|eukprot:NP_001177015.1 Os12g0569100 [Oryza sativa Japonica Group]
MAISKLQLALLAAAMAAAAISPTASGAYTGCATPRKVTIQNLSGRDLPLSETPLANSGALFGAGYVLRHGTHAEFTTCLWTGRVAAPGAAVVEFHVGPDGGAWYQVDNRQAGSPVKVTVTPHGRPLQGHCPAAGCRGGGQCFADAVPGGNCHAVDELKIIYYSP